MKSSTQHGIQRPRLPKYLTPVMIPLLEDYGEVVSAVISNVEWSQYAASSATFEQTLFRRVNLTQARLPKLRLLDVQLETCDFTSVMLEQARLQRVMFIGCRLMGMQPLQARCEDVVFRDCTLEGANFASATFKATRFENCNLREAIFTEADLSRVVFQRCDLTQADLRGGKLDGADLRGSTIHGMQVGAPELKGAIIDPAQAVQVVNLLGIVVKEQER